MDRKIRISVIIPVYNVEDYLQECLDSCAAQTFPDVEFICVNDGSTDSSEEILRKYCAVDERFSYVAQENKGLSGARNTGLRAARGSWIMFLDADDKLKEDALARLDDITSEAETAGRPWDIVIFHADTFPAKIEDDEWFRKTLQFEPKSYDSFTPGVLFGERGSMPFVWRHAYSAELLKRTGTLFDEGVRYGEDVIFPMSIFPDADRFLFSDQCLYSYRLGRSGSLTENVFSDNDIVVERHFETIRHAARYWQERGWLDKYGADFLTWALKYTLLKVRSLPKDRRRARAREMFDSIIQPFGLDNYKRSMSLQGKLMLLYFKVSCML